MDLYLGRRLEGGERIAYPAKHLTTHGLIFGMTGSGKTGLALTMLEEAQRNGIPIIAIDPKGDLTNLALAWPDLAPVGFASWIDPARLEGASALELGQRQAETWRNGLAKDELGEADIAAMRARAHLTVYTPGSTAGVPVSLLKELAAPKGFRELPEEDRQELVSGVVGAILSLVRIAADPLQSREFILLSNIVSGAWERGESLDLPTLVQRVDAPPFSRLGVFELDDFFPPRKRRDFAMQLNGLIASPAFKAWLEGPSLDVDTLLARQDGKQRTSIFYLAHLDDSERMSFVTLLLERVIAWMRQQPGSGQLRALVYMDEVFGYLPPHPGNPPSKRPIMTLLKQARAFGVGCVLATQNPVDVDYKALTNAGTWLIGKLQAEQDRERVLDGLMSAQSGPDSPTRSDISRLVTALEGRQFVLQSAHEPGPTVFRSRFAMSFLRGPMTRNEVARLKQASFYNAPEVASLAPPAPVDAPPMAPPPVAAPTIAAPTVAAPSFTGTTTIPTPGWQAEIVRLPSAPPLPSRYLGRAARSNPTIAQALGLGLARPNPAPPDIWHPALLGEARVRFKVEGPSQPVSLTLQRLAFPIGDRALTTPWREIPMPLHADDAAPHGFAPGATPAWLADAGEQTRARDLFRQAVGGRQQLILPVCAPLGFWGEPNEPLDAFRLRLAGLVSNARDRGLDKARQSRDSQAALLDRQVGELRELLEMDKRELALLRERGDAEALNRVKGRVQVRMEKYKELQAMRAKFVDLAERDMADIEFSALDKLEAAELRAVPVQADHVEILWFGVLWIPAHPL